MLGWLPPTLFGYYLESWVKVAPANLGAVITAEETAALITALSDTGEYLLSPHTMFYKS